MVRVVHASDWHAEFREVPEADLYVFTGDMLPNHPVVERDKGSTRYRSWTIDREHERLHQARDVRTFVKTGGMRPYLGSPDAPVLVVRGNHDFVDLAPLFEGCNLVHEFVCNEVVEVCGLKATGHRGIPYINGLWSDECQRAELLDRVRDMTCEGVHLVLTHYAPQGVLDSVYTSHVGLEGMASALANRILPGGAHCFGHIHEFGGQTLQLGDVTFSNAATRVNVLDLAVGQAVAA